MGSRISIILQIISDAINYHISCLSFKVLITIVTGDILIFSMHLLEKIRFGILCESYVRQIIEKPCTFSVKKQLLKLRKPSAPI